MYKGATPVDTGGSGGSAGGSPYRGARPAPGGLSRPASAGPAPTVDPAEGMPWWEKALVGAGGGMRNVYLGGKNLVGLGTPEEQQEREEWQKNKEHLGGWGTAGEIAGEIVSTLPVGGVVGQGAKVLTKALPAAQRLGSVGGRVANLGTAGRAATEGAISAGIVGDASDQGIGDRLDNVLTGGLSGATAPLVLGGLGSASSKVWTELAPTQNAATRRAYNALERTLGKDEMGRVIDQVENPLPSQLPRTTAAMAQSRRMGALERGARTRGTADFAAHDESVARQAWELTKDATKAVEDIPALKQGTSDIMGEGKEILNKLPLSQDRRNYATQELMKLRNSNEVIANPNLAKELDSAINALDHPDATLGVVPQLYWRLGQEAGDSSAIQQARKVLSDIVDERSGGQFTNMQAGYGATMDQLKAAEAARGVRGAFMDEHGFPTTGNYYGDVGSEAVPQVTSTPLRRAVAKASRAGNTQLMDPSDVEKLGRLADDLKSHEIYKPSMSAGGTGVGLGEAEGLTSAALNAGPLWRLRGALGSAFSGLNEQSQRMVDQALLQPDAFLKMVDAKRALGRPLEAWEKVAEQGLRGMSRSAAISTGE